MLVIGGIFLVAVGPLSICGKEVLWGLTRFCNELQGRASERTGAWDLTTTDGGIIAVILWLVAWYAAERGWRATWSAITLILVCLA